MIWVGVALAGALGALARTWVDRVVTLRVPPTRRRLPLGILCVNVSGSLLLGVLVGAGLHGDRLELLGTGLLGSYTTFSTWMLDTAERPLGLAALNVALSAAAGLAAIAFGRVLG